ncbi:30S ribosomal protein S4 [Candidatus Trichorickettsia mobilis]|uniref:30S ribosomal protein S4 n=1 Tax=Candidatus Trichorickettsia mobilis TaxID=1346319 RepID=UPI002930CE0D|nr:30S ribosomal protein S4 [Candidatus Trichorickettsia mobilis]
MTKIIKSKYKASRRLGVSIWGDGKDAFHTKNYRPGQHGQNAMIKVSDYGLHLKAKQRLKAHYGRVNERQFRNIFTLALKMKGNTGENFVGLLESRLDAVVYRINLARSIFAARQLVSHGHITINGKRVNIPSQRLNDGDIIELKNNSKQIPIVLETATKAERTIPGYLTFDQTTMSGKFVRVPMISDVPYPFDPDVQLVVELYSR